MAKLTKAQREMLELAATSPVDRRGVLTKAQWDVFGRLEAAGLVRRSTFSAHISYAGRLALTASEEKGS